MNLPEIIKFESYRSNPLDITIFSDNIYTPESLLTHKNDFFEIVYIEKSGGLHQINDVLT